MNQLVIFDIDGTLTDTNGVDDECYRAAVAGALEIQPDAIDWSGAAHVTDSEIFDWLCRAHRRGVADDSIKASARSQFVARLTAALEREPHRFASIAGAASAINALSDAGWRVAIATGGWGPSARLKLRAAGIQVPDTAFACADDAASRVDIVRLAWSRAEAVYRCTFDRVVAVGDAMWDVRTAAELGLPFVGIGTRESATALKAAGASIVLPDYTNLNGVITALSAASVPST
jgi:phosphoglycolate phosphatase-like HAD superfamily hydrolase